MRFSVVPMTILGILLLLILGSAQSTGAAYAGGTPIIESQEEIEPPMHISGNDELLQMAVEKGWQGSGTKEDPIVIQGYRFLSDMHIFTISHTDLYVNFTNNWVEGMHHTWCSLVISLTRNVIVCNNTIFGGAIGVHLLAANDSIVTRNTIYDTGFDAVFMDNGCDGNLVVDNYFYNNKETGVLCWTGSTNNVVTNNIIQNSETGVAFRSGSNSNSVLNNTIEQTRISGVDLETRENEIRGNYIYMTAGDGVRVFSTDNIIVDNIIDRPGNRGIYLSPDGNRTLVQHNSLVNCILESILIMHAERNFIRYNDFIGESEKPYAVDHGYLNVFEWNYWDGFFTIDENHDGVFDVPYDIDGSAQNTDPCPVTMKNNMHQIQPVDVVPMESETTETIPTELPTSSTDENTTIPVDSSLHLLTIGGALVATGCVVAFALFRHRQLT